MDDIDIIPALPPINEDDFNDGEDRTFANENIKCPGTAITSKSLEEQSNKNDYLASLPTLSRDERMPGETEEVTTKSVIEDSIQRSYEIVNKSNSLLADSDSKNCNESFSFKGSPLPSGEERAISSGKRNDKCVANDGYSAEDHLDSSVQDAHVAEDDGNNEAKTSTADAVALKTNGMSGKSGSCKMKRMKSADENVMHLTDDDSEIAASWMNPNPQDKMIFRYYAVRVGYARASYFFEDLDSVETEKEMRHFSKSVPMVKIRSAIFLYWDDACQFVETIENLHQDSSLEFKVEYEGFDSIAEAEVSTTQQHKFDHLIILSCDGIMLILVSSPFVQAYLLELDTHLAWEHATSFGMTCPEVNDHKQIPATSNYSGFHYQYPVPQLYIPHSFPLVPSASGLNTEPTALGDHSPQLSNFSSVSSHGVPNARDINSEQASVVTRSKAKLKKSSVTETPLPTKTSNPSRGRPKTVTKRQIVRPRPKKLTVREMEEQKRANINPATSHLYGFHGQYPVPRYYIPHPSLLTHDANELDIQPTMFGTTPAELLHFATLPSHVVPGDREMNLAPASIETRSKSKLNETPIPEAQIPKSKSRPTRGRPKVVRRKPLLRPQPKKLTAKEKEELKKANMEEKWDKMFAKLLDYKEKNDGSLDIPAEVEGAEGDDDCEGIANLSISEKKELQRLRRWCVLQKRHYRQWIRGQNASEFFTDQKYSKLKDAGFEFSALTWDVQYEKLKAYKDAHGTLKVEKEHDEDLFKWAYKQRRILGKHFEGKSVRLTKERLNKLIDLGWQKTAFKQRRIHDPADEERKWDEKYQKVSLFIPFFGVALLGKSQL